MNKDIKERWVKALRSGEYEQGKGYLQTHDGKFCCLGVLCELAVKDSVIDEPYRETNILYYGREEFDEEAVFLPEMVRAWAGLEYSNPSALSHNGTSDNLADMNDGGDSFDQIADAIEASL